MSRLAVAIGRIEFVILRTGYSPPVAPHPALRRRSYVRLQAGERMPEGDFHPSDHAHSQAHSFRLVRNLSPISEGFPTSPDRSAASHGVSQNDRNRTSECLFTYELLSISLGKISFTEDLPKNPSFRDIIELS